jgi:hypothetical protein
MEDQITREPGASSPANSIAIVVPSWDGYQDVWRPFFDLLARYWPDCPYPVILGTNTIPFEHPRVKTLLVGPDRGYASNLISLLAHVEQDWVLLWVDDLFLSAPADTARVQHLVGLAERQGFVHLQLHVHSFGPHAVYLPNDATEEIAELPVDAPYRVTIALGLWRKDALLSMLHLGETAWDIERRGTPRALEIVGRFGCLANPRRVKPPLVVTNGVIKGTWTWQATQLLARERIEGQPATRASQSFRDYVQLAAYMRVRFVAYSAAHVAAGLRGMRWLASKKTA